MNTIIVTRNPLNFTIDYNTMVRDFAYNDLNIFYDTSAGNVEIWVTERNTDEKMFAIKSTDTVVIDGSLYSNIEEIYNSLRTIIFG